MNEWQFYLQARHLLRSAVWPGSSTKVWGNQVYITAGPTEDAVPQLPPPFALIRPGSAQADPEFEDEIVLSVEFVVQLVTALPQDVLGEIPLVGGSRPSETASGGMGLLEIQDRLYSELKLLNIQNGVIIQNRGRGVVAADQVPQYGYAAYRDYNFEFLASVDRYYPAPTSFNATASTGGSVALSWKLAPARFDRLALILRRASGTTAPATSTDGPSVGVGATDTSKSDTGLPSGSHSYSLFQTYDERTPQGTGGSPTTQTDVSDPVTLTVVVP